MRNIGDSFRVSGRKHSVTIVGPLYGSGYRITIQRVTPGYLLDSNH